MKRKKKLYFKFMSFWRKECGENWLFTRPCQFSFIFDGKFYLNKR